MKTGSLDKCTRRFCPDSHGKFLVPYQEVSLAKEILQANRTNFIARLRTSTNRLPRAALLLPLFYQAPVVANPFVFVV